MQRNSAPWLFLLLLLTKVGFAAVPELAIEIKDHLFFPASIEIPAGTKVRLLISNNDPTPEEFESYGLNREKVIPGNSKTVIFIGPLKPGEYPFFGEFYPRTAQGVVIVR
jgi:plastocyanin